MKISFLDVLITLTLIKAILEKVHFPAFPIAFKHKTN